MTITGAAMVAGVTGWPISHSLSPLLHNRWITAANLDAVYAPFAIDPERADSTLRALAGAGVRGMNVTTPHKEVALAIADEVSDAARAIGAANLLTYDGGRIKADNTDVPGFLAGLARAHVTGVRKAVVLGAGGAARATIFALVQTGVEHVTVANRTFETGQRVAEELSTASQTVHVQKWSEREELARDVDLIVNTTVAGMAGKGRLDLDLSGVAPSTTVYDLIYTPMETPLLADAKRHGLRAIGGLEMLIGQARPSFEAFFGVPPPGKVDARSLLIDALGAKA